jgi:CRISPR-associated endonuclease/helicase Cas3
LQLPKTLFMIVDSLHLLPGPLPEDKMPGPYFAHTPARSLPSLSTNNWQPLAEHLRAVAQLARTRAQIGLPSHAGDCSERRRFKELIHNLAYAAGMLHDLGKYRPGFQAKLLFETGISKTPVPRQSTFHKEAGAARAAMAGNTFLAFVIAGHHGGMPDTKELKALVRSDEVRNGAAHIWAAAIEDFPELAELQLSPAAIQDEMLCDCVTRFVFGSLVDADWSDTSAYERRSKGLEPDADPAPFRAAEWLERLEQFVAAKANACRVRNPALAGIRQDIFQSCLEAAALPTGLFSLTVPTGGGKTLSSLAFALKHAATHELRRIIYVAPYLSILEQNARVIRDALEIDENAAELFEHHSLREPQEETREETSLDSTARKAENWDAPIILTTSVQFFESLFANTPSQCRKLHNLARSVVILDECQTLPPDLAAPTCAMMQSWADHFDCTMVLCTATQPALHHREDLPEGLQNVREIIPEGLDLFSKLRRVQIDWPKKDEALDWPTVTRRMSLERAALCVVNTRKSARLLFRELQSQTDPSAVFHLSTSMCPAHRLKILDEVRRRLQNREPCYLASTQLIEAGVDVDFPLVLRELAPLEAVIQAAGRCNREGLLNTAEGEPGGRVVVFRSQDGGMPPSLWYKAGRAIVESSFLNANHEPDIGKPEDVREYFVRLYRSGSLDKHDIKNLRRRFCFETVASKYRLIDNTGEPVAVPTWQDAAVVVEDLLIQAGAGNKTARRKLARYQVNLQIYERAQAGGSIVERFPGVWVWMGGYDPAIGLSPENADMLLMV